MAITLASDASSDAEITDGIGLGDLGSAARLWVRHWPTALEAARRYVNPHEVPGLAAEALIATVSAIAIGRGPREDVHGFVVEAVRELGEDDEPPTGGPEHPAVFVSPMMTSSFAQLDPELQDTLRTSVAVGQLDDEGVRALTVLQHYYLAEHTDRAETPACRRAHIAMMSVADSSTTDGVPGKTWLHMSTCAWCTEAFHEVAFSNIALGALIERAVLTPPSPVLGSPLESFETVAAPYEPVGEPPPPAAEFVEPVYLAPEEPLLFDFQPVPEEEDEQEAAAAVVASHVGSPRRRLIAIGIAAAAAISVIGVILVGQNDDTTAPTAAGTDTTTQAAPTPTPTGGVDPATGTPSGRTTVDAPLAPTRTATSKAPSGVTPTRAATKPASTPTHTKPPTPPSSNPTTSQPTPTPTPTPTATPTQRCNALQRLFGLC